MWKINYKLTFFSPWHCGSGLDKGSESDAMPLQDYNKIPFVPGRTIKGLLREAAELLFDNNFATRIFGNEKDLFGEVYWSNAELPSAQKVSIKNNELNSFLYKGRNNIKIDSRGQTVDKSLRHITLTIPMSLNGSISNISSEEDCKKLQKCLLFIKQLGTQRNRGLGRCIFENITFIQDSTEIKLSLQKQVPDLCYFKCRFNSEIILNSSAATENNHETLDYIPGSNFLGMAAKSLYGKLNGQEFTVFHSGKVRFADGLPFSAGKVALPCPANWFLRKGDSLFSAEKIFPSPDKDTVKKELLPLKQQRGGYFQIKDADSLIAFATPAKSFSLKSGYDSNTRSSKKGILFGYSALQQGSEWLFAVKFSTDISDELRHKIVSSLCGEQRLGRSRGAQYGSVTISLLENFSCSAIAENSPKNNLYYLYAKSNLAFRDEGASFTLQLKPEDLGFPASAKIRYDLSWLRSYSYSPWNGKRSSRDAERLCISKGSVICIESNEAPCKEALSAGVGLFRSEGFGEVLLNPKFLETKKISKPDEANSAGNEVDSKKADTESLLIKHLLMQKSIYKANQLVTQKVADFCEAHKRVRISPSQWGAVRARAVESQSYAEFQDILFKLDPEAANREHIVTYIDRIKSNRQSRNQHPGFLMHGRSAKAWGRGNFHQKLKQAFEDFKSEIRQINSKKTSSTFTDKWTLTFAERLCAEMAKVSVRNK